MNDNGTIRVNYFEKQFLRTKDFIAEQSYHLAKHRLHNITQHGWGIVSGLEIDKDEDNTLFVSPGIAIDGFGRMLVLPVRQTLLSTEFEQKGSETLEVWLFYARQDSNEAPKGYLPCEAEVSNSAYRSQEKAVVVMLKPDDNLLVDSSKVIERRLPENFTKENLENKRVPKISDDPQETWPVFLGRITRQKDGEETTYEIVREGRPYAGLVGESVEAPSGGARVQIGKQENTNQFAVYLCENPPCPQTKPQLSVSKDGTSINNKTTVQGNLTLEGGSVEFKAGPAIDESRPWQIYHATTRASGTTPQKNQLRIEMESKNSNGEMNEVVIGTWSKEKEKFEPCLTISDYEGKTVTVHGDLLVKKKFYPPPAAAVRLTTDAQNLAVSALMLSASSTIPKAVIRNLVDGQIGYLKIIISRIKNAADPTQNGEDEDSILEVFLDDLEKEELGHYLTELLRETLTSEQLEEEKEYFQGELAKDLKEEADANSNNTSNLQEARNDKLIRQGFINKLKEQKGSALYLWKGLNPEVEKIEQWQELGKEFKEELESGNDSLIKEFASEVGKEGSAVAYSLRKALKEKVEEEERLKEWEELAKDFISGNRPNKEAIKDFATQLEKGNRKVATQIRTALEQVLQEE